MKDGLNIGRKRTDWSFWQEDFCVKRSGGGSFQLNFMDWQGGFEDHPELDFLVLPLKDLPLNFGNTWKIGGISVRDDAKDILIKNKRIADDSMRFGLPMQAIVGVGSKRRKAQLGYVRNDLRFVDLKGSITDKLEALKKQVVDAICVSRTLVECLGTDLTDYDCEDLETHAFTPYPGQGALVCLVRTDGLANAAHGLKEERVNAFLRGFNDPETEFLCQLERKAAGLIKGRASVFAKVTEVNDAKTFHFWGWKERVGKKFGHSVYTASGFGGRRPLQAAEALAEKMNEVHAAPVFISRNAKRDDYFSMALKDQGFNVFSQALIEMNRIEIQQLPAFDWLFFSSKHAVYHFFEQEISKKNIAGNSKVKIGAVGKATADAVRKYGKRADFIGYSTDTKLTGKQFAAIAGEATVLFPQAKGSMKTIQQQFTKAAKVIDLTVYETKKQPLDADTFNPAHYGILVFTSPSNVEGWFEKFTILPKQKVVAFGEATANALRGFKIEPHALASSFDDVGLVQTVLGL